MPKNKNFKKNRVLFDSAVIDTEEFDPETKEKIHTIVIDSNHSAHQILKIVNETKKIGEDTRKRLDQQGEQIGVIDRDVQELDYQAKKNKRTVKGINSVWWAIVHFFTPKCLKPQKPNFDDAVVEEDEKKNLAEISDFFTENTGTVTILFDERTKSVADDTSKVLSEANTAMHDLEFLSMGMNKKLRKQNKALDKIADKTDDINDNLRKTSKYARSYLGEPK
ncbi:hypothetical protein CC99x_005800 [Candidatus Berkiella cookevillensis]|nr:hypothetical protein [Candidatus Berkiella cookevillensis]MCS5708417.1 hypothetical protein [Candidatus Berkiella cookevillensis]